MTIDNTKSTPETATQAPALAAAPSLLHELQGHLEMIERSAYEATGDDHKAGLFEILQAVDMAKGDLSMVTDLVRGTLDEHTPAEPLFEAGSEQDPVNVAASLRTIESELNVLRRELQGKPEPMFTATGDRAKRPDPADRVMDVITRSSSLMFPPHCERTGGEADRLLSVAYTIVCNALDPMRGMPDATKAHKAAIDRAFHVMCAAHDSEELVLSPHDREQTAESLRDIDRDIRELLEGARFDDLPVLQRLANAVTCLRGATVGFDDDSDQAESEAANA